MSARGVGCGGVEFFAKVSGGGGGVGLAVALEMIGRWLCVGF